MIEELRQSLGKPRLSKRLEAIGLTPNEHAANYASLAAVVVPDQLPGPVPRDPDDDRVLACAKAASANAIVTGDDDLLVLGAWEGIPILRVGECLEVIAAQTLNTRG